MKAALVINSKAARVRSDPAISRRLREVFQEHGIEPRVLECGHSTNFEELAGRLPAEVELLVGGGGDGTLNAVAKLAFDRGLAVCPLPLGTHNNFTRDLGLNLPLEEVVEIIARGRTELIDLGEVNGRIFLNNSSVGAYPRAVREREALRERYGLRKMAAMMIAVLRVFFRSPVLDARVVLPDGSFRPESPFIFVGNNEYDVNLTAPRFRETLQGGKLWLLTAQCEGLADFFRLLWLVVSGRMSHAPEFQVHRAEQFTIEMRRRDIRVSTDGEIWRARTPLEYRVLKRALRVVVP